MNCDKLAHYKKEKCNEKMVIHTNYQKSELNKKASEALEMLRKSNILKDERFIYRGEVEAFGMRKAMRK